MRAALAEIENAGFYANRAAHYTGVCRVLMKHMNWNDRTSRPGHLRIAAVVGVSADTVGRAVGWLQEHGLLGLVSPGTTDTLRPGVLYAGTGNLAAVYVLTVPKRRSRTPRHVVGQSEFADLTAPRSGVVKAPRARPAEKTKNSKARAARGLTMLPPGGPGLHHCPKNRTEGLAAAQAVRERSRHLGQLSAEHVRWLARAFFGSGWTGHDVLAAIARPPRGRPYGYTVASRSPAKWAAWRLKAWVGPDGVPLPSPGQLAAEAHRRDVEEQERRRAERRSPDPRGYAEGAAAVRVAMARALAEASVRRSSPTAASSI